LIGKRADGRSQQEPMVDPNTSHRGEERLMNSSIRPWSLL
jgi:hypothetical protein